MRHPLTVALAIVCVVAAAGAISASGAGAWLGFDPAPTAADDVDEAEDGLREYNANREKGETNFIGSVFAGTTEAFGAILLVYDLYDLLVSSGLPPWAAGFAASPVVWSVGFFMIYMISGRAEARPR